MGSKSFKSELIKIKDKLTPNYIFFLTLIVTILATAIYLIATRGAYTETFLFSDKGDNFMDFFHPINHSYTRDPYIDTDRIYPAICYLFYYILSLFIPYETCEEGGGAIRASMEGQLLFISYTIITTLILFILLYKLIKNGSQKKKILIVTLLLFSSCFIFQFMRANIIIITLICTLFYVNYYDSDKRYLREMSLILLALAACIKIYPLAFAFFLVNERRWRDVAKFLIYTLLLFVVPFGVIGGFNQIPVMAKNLFVGVGYTEGIGFGYKVNITNTLSAISKGFHHYLSDGSFKIISYGMLLLSVVSLFFIKEKWKQYAIIGLVVAGIPGFSFIYSLIFMVIPLIMFMNEEGKEKILKNYIYMILFIAIFAFFPYLDNLSMAEYMGGNYSYTVQTLIEGVAVILFLAILIVEGLINCCTFIKDKYLVKQNEVTGQ